MLIMDFEAVDHTENNDNEAGLKQAGRRVQIVNAGSSQFGIFADEISAIVDWQQPAPLPHAPAAVLGVVSIQGRMLTVLDLATIILGEGALSNPPRSGAAQLIALRGDEQLALAVDGVGEIVAFPENVSKSNPVTAPVLGVLQHEGAEISILNLPGLFPTAIQGRQRRQRQF